VIIEDDKDVKLLINMRTSNKLFYTYHRFRYNLRCKMKDRKMKKKGISVSFTSLMPTDKE